MFLAQVTGHPGLWNLNPGRLRGLPPRPAAPCGAHARAQGPSALARPTRMASPSRPPWPPSGTGKLLGDSEGMEPGLRGSQRGGAGRENRRWGECRARGGTLRGAQTQLWACHETQAWRGCPQHAHFFKDRCQGVMQLRQSATVSPDSPGPGTNERGPPSTVVKSPWTPGSPHMARVHPRGTSF